jgi:hypothetical protein
MAGMIVFGLGAGNVAAAQAADRSVTVNLTNSTGCTLVKVAYWMDHGITIIPANASIPRGTTDFWRTESRGFMTGTEGHARYLTTSCSNGSLNFRFVEVHWNNPYLGTNTYDFAGTGVPFIVPHSGGGGNQALVSFFAQQL